MQFLITKKVMGIGTTSPALDVVVDVFRVTILIPPLTCAGRDHYFFDRVFPEGNNVQ